MGFMTAVKVESMPGAVRAAGTCAVPHVGNFSG
jgi:hypothetical protein